LLFHFNVRDHAHDRNHVLFLLHYVSVCELYLQYYDYLCYPLYVYAHYHACDHVHGHDHASDHDHDHDHGDHDALHLYGNDHLLNAIYSFK